MQGEKAAWAFLCVHWSRGCVVAPPRRDHHPRGPFVPLQHCPLAGRQQAAPTGHNTGFPVCRKQVCFLLSFWLYSQSNSNQHFFKTWMRQGLLCFRLGNPWGWRGARAGCHHSPLLARPWWHVLWQGHETWWGPPGHWGSLPGPPCNLVEPCSSRVVQRSWLNHHYFYPDKIPIRKKWAQDVR